jgi:type I restriction enzyme S subunit
MMKLRHIAHVRNSNVDKIANVEETPVRLCNYVDVYKNDFITNNMPFMAGTATEKEIQSFRLRVGDVIITKDSEDHMDIGVPALVRSTADDLVCGYHLTMLRPVMRRVLGEYLFWALQAHPVRDAFSNAAYGVTRYGLSLGAMKSISVPVPNLDIQNTIAKFLDEETTRIDDLIQKKKALIATLKEKRQIEIDNAVIGKTADAEMADTGILFMPQSKKGWSVETLSRTLLRIEQGWSPLAEDRPVADDEYGVLKVGCVNRGVFDASQHKTLPSGEAVRSHLLVRSGDILMSRGNTPDLVGSVAKVPPNTERMMLCDLLYRIIPSTVKVDRDFLVLFMNSRWAREQINIMASGSSHTMPKISQAKIKRITWARPPIKEQRSIAAFVQERAQKILTLRMKTRNSIGMLQELRAALVTAVVTGQIDPATYRRKGSTDQAFDRIEKELST